MKRFYAMLALIIVALLLTVAAPLAAQTGGGMISVGDVITSTLGGSGDRWIFSGTAGEAVTISMTSDAFDTVLELLGPSGAQLTTDDDGGGGRNSLISSFILPQSSSYTIVARSFGGASGGAYTLSLQTTTIAQSGGGVINVGETVTGNLIGGEDEWTFEGRAGDTVTINLISRDFDTYLELHGPSNVQFIDDDDGGQGLNSRIGNYMLRIDGFYTIIVRGFSPGASGMYTLSLEGSASAVAGSGTMTYGETIRDNIVNGQGGGWTFTGEAGDLITISMSGEIFAKALELYDASGALITSSEVDTSISSEVNTVALPVVLPATGDYTIVPRDLSELSGSYALSLTLRAPAGAIANPNLEFDGTRVGASREQAEIIFVNGILTPFAEYEQQLMAVQQAFTNAGLGSLPVMGIYNATNSTLVDAVAASEDLRTGQLAKRIADDNPAVQALVEEIMLRGINRPLVVVGHGQGTAIVAAALRLVFMERSVLAPITVYTFGNVASTYPDGPTYFHCIHSGDTIAEATDFIDAQLAKVNTTIRPILGVADEPDALFLVTPAGIEIDMPNHTLAGYLEDFRPGRCLPLGG